MKRIYTIGFTKKTAEEFFSILRLNNIDIVLDIRLNNTSQLAAFTKFPDIRYFLQEICKINYLHDTKFAPNDDILRRYKKKEIDWEQYVIEFEELMDVRNLNKHIMKLYDIDKNICLLCSESSSKNCHRSLVANRFKDTLELIDIINL